MSGLLKSSIGRKVAMALSGLFLVVFLTQHFVINSTSVLAPELFNTWSHFMGTNGLVQFALQPVLILGVIFHFVMGFVLEIQNRKARPINYVNYKGSANASWMSRNMIISGLVILAFLGLHFYDFWIHEITIKYVEGDMTGLVNPNDPSSGFRYLEETVHKFESPVRVGLYVISFVLLALHLWHGFASTFQSVGFNNKYAAGLSKFAKVWSIAIPVGFICIAVYHHFNQIPH
ncbi:succinate dehydrogenase cytochrome b subunit [uncultured Dokdonia sp.]|uniref:succinate dehydrogenase cytochrome b subunit n=1 Tax=uncultured Dokdonia sp. TaxID=575653 RepID=UPI0026230B3D|nr:succinate dehydrogenase cytochrome b subunit [uncultured Dokdonia sp.]